MKDNEKKYRRSALSIVCYAVAALMILYIIYMMGNTVAQVNQYYAQYQMKAQITDYFTYILQTIISPLMNTFMFFIAN